MAKSTLPTGQKQIMLAKREKGVQYYDSVRNHHDPNEFETVCGVSVQESYELYMSTIKALTKPVKVRLEYDEDEKAVRSFRKRAIPDHVMLFLFLVRPPGGNESGQGVEQIALDFGISKGSVSKYVRYAGQALFDVISDDEEEFIYWPSSEERKSIKEFVFGFKKCIGFEFGTK